MHMAKRQPVLLCSRCEAPFRSQAAFCEECGGPSPWATHEERVAWEVRQWRKSRAGEPERGGQMMLVRTDQGYVPAPVETHYVWDQPLHPEREQDQELATNGHAVNGNGSNGHPTNGHAAAHADSPPVVETGRPVVEPPTPPIVEPPAPPIATAPERSPTPLLIPSSSGDDTVSVSKKAVAVAIAIVLGLPLGGKALDLAKSEPEAAVRKPAAAAPGAPAPIAATRSGFVQISGDAVRYAVLIRNPNKGLSARSVGVSIALLDGRGRLIGSDVERLAGVPAASTIAVAGTADADGRVARLAVRLSLDGFVKDAVRPFTVRSVALSRSGRDLVVRAAVSATRATRGARVVAVHLDAKGGIVGGDVAYVDVPRAPRSVTASVRTSGAAALVRKVQIYVISPR